MFLFASSLLIKLLSTSRPCKSFHHRVVPRRRWSIAAARKAEPLRPGKKEPFNDWMDKIAFPAEKFPVSPLYLEPGVHLDEYLNTEKDTGCIMDDPARTMAHPIIDFDVKKAAEMIFKSAQSNVTGRGMPVFAIARGSGGGKSRIEEEIRRYLLPKEKALPVAITFNHMSEIERDSWWYDMDEKGMAYSLSLTVRVASAILGVPYATTMECVFTNLARLDLRSTDEEEMIREMIKFFMGRVNAGRAALNCSPAVAPVDTFVFLLDENRKVDTFAKQSDMGRIVRAALMNRKQPGLNIAVVISDLGFLPENLRTAGDREVVLLVPPPRLSPDRVLESWWKPKEGATAEQRALLLTLIAVYNNIPRALEFAANYLRLPENINRRVDNKLVSDLMEHMLEKAERRYGPQFPSMAILEAAFFRTSLRLDASLLDAFQDSVVTNPVSSSSHIAKMVPDVSLLLLKVACGKVISMKATDSTGVLARVIEQGIDSVQGTMFGTVDSPPLSVGDALEEALTQVLRIRLALAITTGSETLTLQGLCGMKIWSGFGKETFAALRCPLPVKVYLDEAQKVVKLSATTYTSSGTAFLAELDAIEVSAVRPVRILRSAPGDSWDVCVKAYNPSTGRPFHVFFDCKSGAEFVPGRNNSMIEDLLRERKRYINTATVLSSGTAGGPPRDLVFLYCITHEGIPEVPEGTLALREGEAGGLVVNGRDLLPHHCAIMGRDGMLELLGPFAELFRAVKK